jgi:hypothetical protein
MTAATLSAAELDRAAAAIASARRTLVTGLVDATAVVAKAACDVAEAAGAAIDPGSWETSRVAGPLVARIGAVTAAAEELRDRADLVVLWFCDPERIAPGLVARLIGPPLPGGSRRTIAVGPHAVVPPGESHRHVDLTAAAAVDLARLVEALIRGVALDEAAGDPAALAAAREVAAAVSAAHTVGIVSDWRDDALGLASWSTASLVRAIAHVKPAFELPLGERDDPALAVCAWRYGAAGAIEQADRAGARFLPAEADAERLIARHDVDCVVVVGHATGAVAGALARADGGRAVIHVPADAGQLGRLADRIRMHREPAA